ncbi:MAG: hypothetical protein KDC07_12480, partial [Chitinophagaceae bacterium]|nr:hypothetical protein [Chitinophagaceae bacterium]
NILLKACNEHKTVDTYAKMLWSTDKNSEYKLIKCTIILFFELYRYFNNKVDKRYDAFFASIISKEEPRLPDEIRIISWNYDYEFEKAFMKYALSATEDIHSIYDELNVIHKNSIPVDLKNKFRIIKVNGTTGFYDTNQKLTLGLNLPNFHRDKDIADMSWKDIMPLFINYNKYAGKNSKYIPAISFEWEKDDDGSLKKAITECTSMSRALVVIGYSFPTFNREMDTYILQSLKLQSGDTQVYIQDADYYSIQSKIERFIKKDLTTFIHQESNLDEFYLPHEFR